MTIQECTTQLLETVEKYEPKAYDAETKCFGLARIGYPDQKIVAGKMEQFLHTDMGPPLHSFVICAPTLHSIEK